MRKVNTASFLAQSKHASEWQRDTLGAARAAGHHVFQDCVMIDYSKIEQRIMATSRKQLRSIYYGMNFGMSAKKLYEKFTALLTPADKLKVEILIFERWQSEDRARIRRENAAIAYAAAETGIVPLTARSRAYSHQGTITGRFTTDMPNFKEIDRPAGVWNPPTEEESDAERARR